MNPIIKGAIIAPQDCVENTMALFAAGSIQVISKERSWCHKPGTPEKKFKNTMKESWNRVVAFIQQKNLEGD